MPNPFTRLDDAVIDRVAQPVVDRFPHVPLREQVRFCTMGAAGGAITLAGWKHRAGKLDATDAVFCGFGLVLLGLAYAGAWGIPTTLAARNPNRVDRFWRFARLCLLSVTAAMAGAFTIHLAALGWDTHGVLILISDTLYTATLYAAACDNPPPPVAKTSAVHAGAGT